MTAGEAGDLMNKPPLLVVMCDIKGYQRETSVVKESSYAHCRGGYANQPM